GLARLPAAPPAAAAGARRFGPLHARVAGGAGTKAPGLHRGGAATPTHRTAAQRAGALGGERGARHGGGRGAAPGLRLEHGAAAGALAPSNPGEGAAGRQATLGVSRLLVPSAGDQPAGQRATAGSMAGLQRAQRQRERDQGTRRALRAAAVVFEKVLGNRSGALAGGAGV